MFRCVNYGRYYNPRYTGMLSNIVSCSGPLTGGTRLCDYQKQFGNYLVFRHSDRSDLYILRGVTRTGYTIDGLCGLFTAPWEYEVLKVGTRQM